MNPIYLIPCADHRVARAIETIKASEAALNTSVTPESWGVSYYDEDTDLTFMELPQHTVTLTRLGKSLTMTAGMLALFPQFAHSEIKAAGLI